MSNNLIGELGKANNEIGQMHPAPGPGRSSGAGRNESALRGAAAMPSHQ
jgi:hypothetical protein